MEHTELHSHRRRLPGRVEACRRTAQRLIEELGDEADKHCLTITYHLLRAGRQVDATTVVRFASMAAEVAYCHRSYYVAGRYFEAAARAGANTLSLDERAELFHRGGKAFQRLADSGLSMSCFQAAMELYVRSGNQSGLALTLRQALRSRNAFGAWVAEATSEITAQGLEWLLSRLPEAADELRVRAYGAVAAYFYRSEQFVLAEEYARSATTIAGRSQDPQMWAVAMETHAMARRARRRGAGVMEVR